MIRDLYNASLLVVALSASSANAALIDQGDITVDTGTGLKWLDLTETLDLSIQDIRDGFGGFLDDGWSVATSSQVDQLFSNAGATAPASDLHFYPDATITDNMLDLFGITGFLTGSPYGGVLPGPIYDQAPYGLGLADNENGMASLPIFISQGADSATAGSSECCVLYTDSGPDAGVWLTMTTEVPLPSSLALVGVALLGLARAGAARQARGYAKR
jgi:hypothetical protein